MRIDDLLAALHAVDLEVTAVDISGTTGAGRDPATLYAMKRDTVRGRDRDDAERLRQAFELEG